MTPVVADIFLLSSGKSGFFPERTLTAEDDGSGRSHDAEEGRVDGVFLSENHFDKVLLAAVLFRVAAMECVE